jgi:DNA-binding response OmpR family regulator
MPKVMVIEDDPTMLTLLVSLLEIEGFDVAQANHRQKIDAVLGEVLAEQPDVLLLDIQLSHFSGFDLMRKLKHGDRFRNIKILVSSGRDLSHECLQEGADSFLMKPYMPDELIENIYSLLGSQS